MDDNPGLDVADYRAHLAMLDPVTRAQLEEGDFDAVESGEYFREEWFKIVDAAPANATQRLRYWDLAGTKPRPGRDPDWSAGCLMSIERTADKKHRIYIEDMAHFREDPGETEDRVKACAERDGKRVRIEMEEEPGSSGKNNTHNYAARILFGYQLKGHRKTGPKEEYWKGLSAAARNGLVHLVRGPWVNSFVRELCSIPVGHDDQADAAAAAFASLTDSPATFGDLPEETFERRF